MMSYDLYFRSDTAPSTDAVRAWFAARPNYHVSESQAAYYNEATGVYWTFDFGGEPSPDDIGVAFNLNYFRPSYFGIEAEPELTAFVRAFGLGVSDPQAEGMEEGSYSPEGFLRGWNYGNAFGYRAIGASHPVHAPATLPEAINTGVWRWNGMREAYMDLLCSVEMVCGFVPTVYRLQREGESRVLTAAIWGGAMEIALPEVDLILAMQVPKDPPRVIPVDTLRPLLEASPVRLADHRFELDGRAWRAGLRHWLVDPVSPELAARLATEGEPWPLQGISPDQVLDAERVANPG
jgi:hypothetical protein